MGFSDIFSGHIFSTVAETIGITNYAGSFGAKSVQKTTFEAGKMMLGPWNQQDHFLKHSIYLISCQMLVSFHLPIILLSENRGNAFHFDNLL